jgi:UDP-N-acetylmuramoyl-tripeptide--D-alanyl-D-alanine ligase
MQNAAIALLTIVDILLVALSQIALWQRKEYRLDRMKAYLESPEGSIVRQWAVLLAGLLLGGGWITARSNETLADYFGIASLLVLLIAHVLRIRKKGVIRPTLTTRAGVILLGTVLVCMAWKSFLIFPEFVLALQLATLLFFLPALIAGIVFLVTIPASFQKRRIIAKATRLRSSLKSLTVVGITGSVGKTSTKTYLLHLLGGESKTICATREHRNSPYVVSLDMLSRITKNTKIYIAEMGAYKKGEIKELADLTQPTIGIVTAITNQHAALFGSLENLAAAKWELINALPSDGIAILNADDERIIKKAKGLQKKVVWYSLAEKNPLLKHASVIGCGQLGSVLAAVTAAKVLGVSEDDIAKRLASLPVIPRTMERKVHSSGAVVIDDSYSASEESVRHVVEYLSSCKSSDIRLALVPIIELGSEAAAVHERIGRLLAPLDAKVYIYGDAYKADIQRGLGKKRRVTVTWFDDAKSMATALSSNISSETTMLLEGRLPSIVRTSVV